MIKNKKNNEKKDIFTTVMIVQTIIGSVLIVSMLLSFRSDGKFLSVMTDAYVKYMQSDFTAEDMLDALNNLKNEQYDVDENVADTVKNKADDESVAKGGKDIEFSSLETLEGISFENLETGISMQYPLENYQITSEFGYRTGPITNEPGLHTGIDMAADYGTPIFAAANGVVVDAAWDNSYGNYVKILHRNNTVSIYAHCSQLCVDVGDDVSRGEKIAQVGSTGASTGNHLHFEVRKDNIRINPYYLLNEEE